MPKDSYADTQMQTYRGILSASQRLIHPDNMDHIQKLTYPLAALGRHVRVFTVRVFTKNTMWRTHGIFKKIKKYHNNALQLDNGQFIQNLCASLSCTVRVREIETGFFSVVRQAGGLFSFYFRHGELG